MDHYRLISNLPFLSKIMEKAVFQQLYNLLTLNDCFDVFQSVFNSIQFNSKSLYFEHDTRELTCINILDQEYRRYNFVVTAVLTCSKRSRKK